MTKINSMHLKSVALIFLVLFLGVLSSCVKPNHPKPEEEDPDPTNTAKNIGELVISKFAISPSSNDHIYSEVKFMEKDGSKYVFTGDRQIKYYKTAVSALKMSFASNAAKVTVNSITQESDVTVNNFTNPVTYRFYAEDGNYKDYTVSLTNPVTSYSGLPVLVITTVNAQPIASKDDWVEGTVRIDKQESTNSTFELSTSTMEIKGRGNRTWSYEKKPYTFKLPEKTTMMGMNKHKRWVLLANFVDRTLLRNKVVFEVAHMTGIQGGKSTGLAWTPSGEYVEVILNGVWIGNYLLAEQVRVDSKRVPIAELTPASADITGGYLVELDHHYDEEYKFFSQHGNIPFMVSAPDAETITPAQKTYITNYINNLESIIFNPNFPTVGGDTYKDLLDIDSFADWWIIHELVHNRETRIPGSWYMYKKENGKLYAGPPWDFDLTTFISSTEWIFGEETRTHQAGYFPENTNRQFKLWYFQLMKDPAFKARVKERWTDYYTNKFQTIPAFIDAQSSYIAKSAALNFTQWTPPSSGENQDNGKNFSEAVVLMRTNYLSRLSWLNNQIKNW